jgi:hypothetical protein
VISGDRGGQGVTPSLSIHLFENVASKTDQNVNPSVEVHNLVGKLSTAETLLTEVQCKVSTCPISFLLTNVCNQYNKTNVMHFLFSLLRIRGLYTFRALLVHLQEALRMSK